jgi:propanol-preferring alcohol dehydrogenase
VNGRRTEPGPYLQKEIGGAHAVLITAPSHVAFEQALGMVRRRGTITLIALPPGSFPLPIVPVVLEAITLRGSIVGGRLDLKEALDFAAEGKVKATIERDRLENINNVFERMRAMKIEGRVVLDLAAS